MTEESKLWLIKAFEDYKVVVHEMNLPEKEIVSSIVCFHCQQFVEKVFKAYLVLKGIEFARTHNLEFLKEICAKEDKDFDTLELGDLTTYAVEIRYPEKFLSLSSEKAKECFEIAKKVKNFILQKLQIDEKDIERWINELK